MKKLFIPALAVAVALFSTASAIASIDLDPPTRVPESGTSLALLAISIVVLRLFGSRNK